MREISEMNLNCVELVTENVNRAVYILTEKLHINNLRVMEQDTIRIYDRTYASREIAKTLAENGVPIVSIERKAESLEDYFLKMTEERGGEAVCGN